MNRQGLDYSKTLQRLARLDTGAVSDALDGLSLEGVALGLRPLTVPRRISGRVVTVELKAGAACRSARHLGTAAIESVRAGDVIVVANGGRTEMAGWGGILSAAAKQKGVAGVVVDGACRDLDEAQALDFPVYAKAGVPVTARGRVVEASYNRPIDVAGLRVNPGDLVIADRSGVVFVPVSRAGEVISKAETIASFEKRLLEKVLAGAFPTSVMDTEYESVLGSGEGKQRISERFTEWKELGTATISDALDRFGIAGQGSGIKPIESGFRLAGFAFTVRMVPLATANETVGDFIDDVPEGNVVVIDNGGKQDATVWGDILTTVAQQRRLGGTVIHGVCRDTARSVELKYPLFSRGNTMRTGKGRVRLEAVNVPVFLGRVSVRPGDIIVGDRDGVVVIPRQREEEVLAAARNIREAEVAIRSTVQRGGRLDRARERLGYHTLQSLRSNC